MSTIKQEVILKSVALMTGVESEARVCPSDKKGLRFHFNGKTIDANIDNVVSTEHCTVIGNNEIKVMLIEHFMAACAICKIDSLDVYLSHYELPILDGGSKKWVDAFNNAGIENPDNKKYMVKEPLSYLNGKTHLVVLPSENLNVTYSVNFRHKDLSNRWVALNMEKLPEIIEARTFGYLNELEMLQKAGYARGASIENTLGLTEDGYTAELKSEYEPIKHKILDLIGDFYLAGFNILNSKAEIIVKEAGHTVHTIVAKNLKDKYITEE
ncbi:TPA: UDP-3-O-acyl-N-acetylglucosamine deacetylase [Candidatus Avigastranaerophilus faecigallinarum]|nr:UDP-3-O-acyl-N-acetylglucosamine deacetylase [Candidatus Avigastranaerophilus faecigallinarum]